MTSLFSFDSTAVDTWRLSGRLTDSVRAWASGTRPGIRIIDLPAAHVRVRVAGTGATTIVFACDPPNVVEQYDVIFERLSPHYRVVCLEQPGFGFSFPRAGFGFSRPEYVDILIEVLRVLDLAPYVLAFPCVSGFYALEVARRHPDLIEKLVLMQIGSWSDQRQWARRVAHAFTFLTLGIPIGGSVLMKLPFVGQGLGVVIEPSFTRKTYPFVLYKGRRNQELLQRFRAPTDEAFQRGACNCQPSFYQRFFREDQLGFGEVSQPTLLLWTDKDRSHARSDPYGVRRHAPGAEVRMMTGVGHHLELEDPEQLCREVLGFLRAA